MKIILTKKKEKIYVDDNQYEKLSKFKWYIVNDDSGNKYARRNGGKYPHQTAILMHREIMDPTKELQVDHIDGNGLNNQKHNLRICTNSQNAANLHRNKRNTSGYKGVSWNIGAKKWCAEIKCNGKKYNLGYFTNPKLAHERYLEKAKEVFGKYFSDYSY